MKHADDIWRNETILSTFNDPLVCDFSGVVAEEGRPATPPLLNDPLSPPTSPPFNSSAPTPGSASGVLESVTERSREEGSDMEAKPLRYRQRIPSVPVSPVKATPAKPAGASGRLRLNEETVRPPRRKQITTKKSVWVFDKQKWLDSMKRNEKRSAEARSKRRSMSDSSLGGSSRDTYAGETPAGTSRQRSEAPSKTSESASSPGSQSRSLRLASSQHEARVDIQGAGSRREPLEIRLVAGSGSQSV